LDKEICELISQMTTAEKVAMCSANSLFTSGAVPRLGIDEIVMSDGPHGVRREFQRDEWISLNSPLDKCTYLPTASCLAATWNTEMAELFGKTLGEEARYREKDIILGPGVNIIRNPLCGRNFEYISEDPCLTSEMAIPLIKGIQSRDVAACVKHYALNNQELDRFNVNIEVSKNALFEIYLSAFEKIVKFSKPYAIMGAYNKYENQHCCHNRYLVKDILKDKWGFDGVFISDWGGTHSTDEAIENGLDIEMGTCSINGIDSYLGKDFLAKAEKSDEIKSYLDDKVKRILRLVFNINKMSPDRKKGSYNTKEHQTAAYKIASEAMVLLKNNNVLPFSGKLKKILVFGVNAEAKHAEGGNSSGVIPYYEISILEGIKNRFKNCEIEYIPTTKRIYLDIPSENLSGINPLAGCKAYNCEFYEDENFGQKSGSGYEQKINVDNNSKAMRYYSDITVSESGNYEFLLTTDCKTSIYLDGNKMLETKSAKEPQKNTFSIQLPKGQTVKFELFVVNQDFGSIDLKWSADERKTAKSELLEKARLADAVIACCGLNHNYESEAWDRENLYLPDEDNEVIPLLIDANKNTVVTVTAGAPVIIPWAEKANAIIWNWYYGMEGGNALADIIAGKINPSGKLPFTLAKRQEDYPCFRYGEYREGNCRYNEGLFVGYRGFDKDDITPQFPFGYGLSYSEFEYSGITAKKTADGVSVSFTIQNLSGIDAKETAQVYIGSGSENRPKRELKAFKKVDLKAKSKVLVNINLSQRDFMYFDTKTEEYALFDRKFRVEVASSSRDIRIVTDIEI